LCARAVASRVRMGQARAERRQPPCPLRRRLRHRPGNSTTTVRDAIAAGSTRPTQHHGDRADRELGPTHQTRSRRFGRTSSSLTASGGHRAQVSREPSALPAARCSPPRCANLMPTLLQDGQDKGTDYGIPFTTSTRALYYNKKIFARPGSRLRPRTWGPAAMMPPRSRQGLHRLRHAVVKRGSPSSARCLVLVGWRRYLKAAALAINSAQNLHALEFMRKMARRATPAESRLHGPQGVWGDSQGRGGMMLGSPASLRFIQAAGKPLSSDYATARSGPADDDLDAGVADDVVAFNTGGAPGGDPEVPRFRLQGPGTAPSTRGRPPARHQIAAQVMGKEPEFRRSSTNIPPKLVNIGQPDWTTLREPDQDRCASESPAARQGTGRDPADRYQRRLRDAAQPEPMDGLGPAVAYRGRGDLDDLDPGADVDAEHHAGSGHDRVGGAANFTKAARPNLRGIWSARDLGVGRGRPPRW